MQKQKQGSFLGKIVQNVEKESIWNSPVSTLYENDTIELQFNGHYISQGNKILKPINLEIGQKTLYKIKDGNPKGKISLNFTTMTLKIYQDQYVFCLQKNNRFLDIVAQNIVKLQELFVRKCVLTTFHEEYVIKKVLQNSNKNKNYFVVTKKTTKQKFAVKAYNKEILKLQQSGCENLKKEIKAMRMLNQDSIIQLHEVHETQNSIYLIMDLISGGQLSQRMSATLFSDNHIKQLMYNLLKVLFYIDQKNCKIRNLSSDNILLKTKESKLDIVLFNFSEVQFDCKLSQFKPLQSTPYLAPELQNNIDYHASGKCDIYSAGVIFYKLATGDSVFNQTDFYQFKQESNSDFFFNLKTKKAQQSLIKKMLRNDPKIRYSAEKCLTHPYFKSVFNSIDIIPGIKQTIKPTYQEKIQTQEKCSELGSPHSIESQPSGSAQQDGQEADKKQHSKLNHQKEDRLCLLKLALQNSFNHNQRSNDDMFFDPNLNSIKSDVIKKQNSSNF